MLVGWYRKSRKSAFHHLDAVVFSVLASMRLSL